jgi:endo-1,4-beta-xylanase
MTIDSRVTRRAVLLGAAGAAVAAGLPGGVAGAHRGGRRVPPLWRTAAERGIVFGTAYSTRLSEDAEYVRLVDREAALLFTEDDLLWYKLKPTPDSDLDFTYADQFMAFAAQHHQLVFAAHLVWDEGFGEGWGDELWELSEDDARELILGIIDRVVRRYRGRVAGWIVVNEAIDAHTEDGLRTDVPWYATIGPSYVAEAFHAARAADPHATLVLNEFGFETDTEFDAAADRRRNALKVIDALLAEDVPLDAFGIQGHLAAAGFREAFDARAYRRFLSELADRGLEILITEVDVLDDGLPADERIRDRAIADAYERYLDVTLAEPAVKSVMTFGLSDRYTWLQEDYPRDDGAARRPLPFDDQLEPKPALHALSRELDDARRRRQLWRLRRR